MNTRKVRTLGISAAAALSLAAIAFPLAAHAGDHDDYVTTYSRTVSVTCDAATFEHPVFKGGFGFPNGYLLYVGETEAIAQAGEPFSYEPNTVFVHEFDNPLIDNQVYFELKATYEGQSFQQKLGHSVLVSTGCVPVEEVPEEEVPEEEVPEEEIPEEEEPEEEEPGNVVPEAPEVPEVPVIEVPTAPVAPVAVETARR